MKKINYLKHDYLACSGNICVTDPENHLTTWFPDEAICTYKPLTKWQKNQIRTQKLFRQGKVSADLYFTKDMLEQMVRVRRPIGKDPDKAL